jgi:hypothetical protein
VLFHNTSARKEHVQPPKSDRIGKEITLIELHP